MGWRSFGQRSMSSSTNLGTSDRAAQSAERSRTCCSDGTSPVRSSQKRPARVSILATQQACGRRTFGERLRAARCLGKDVLALGDGLAAETDTLFGVEDGSLAIVSLSVKSNGDDIAHLPNKRLDAASAAVDLVKGDLADDLVAMLPMMMSMRRCGEDGGDGKRTFGAS